MNNIIEFPIAEKNEPHGSGNAHCILCGHKFVLVAPIGTVWTECPNCHSEKAIFTFPFSFPEGQLVRECNCGNQLFYISPEGHMCANCGTYQMYE